MNYLKISKIQFMKIILLNQKVAILFFYFIDFTIYLYFGHMFNKLFTTI